TRSPEASAPFAPDATAPFNVQESCHERKLGPVQGLQVVANRTGSFRGKQHDGIVHRRGSAGISTSRLRQQRLQSFHAGQTRAGERVLGPTRNGATCPIGRFNSTRSTNMIRTICFLFCLFMAAGCSDRREADKAKVKVTAPGVNVEVEGKKNK